MTSEGAEAEAFLAELRSGVGTQAPLQSARHPVNGPAIADWCDAIGDGNPCYLDPDYAAASVHGGLVAPPATLDIWDRPGLPAQYADRPRDDPRSRVLDALDAAGFVGVVAVNSELEIRRYLRPGDVLSHVQVLEDVSAEKQTGLGTGHFVTTRARYSVGDEHVGDLLFRILKFRPGTGRTRETADAGAPAPDPDPANRPRPAINRDNQFFWDGARRYELRIQICEKCDTQFFPPTPRCWECGSMQMGYRVASGRGRLFSYAVPHYPQVPGFRYPLLVGLVELDEGVRIVANIVGCRREHLRVGMPVDLQWLDSHPALVEGATDSRGPVSLPQFRPATPQRNSDTRSVEGVDGGTELPLWALPVTPTLIVSGALATRDFQDVHHDRDLAHRKGSADIFLNINTSLGLMQRYVTDWAGPQARVSALRVRLGAPAYPYDPLTFTGAVTEADKASGRVVVGVRAFNSLGDHVSGTVELELPR